MSFAFFCTMIREPTENKISAVKSNAFTTAPPIVNNNDTIYFLPENDKQLNQSLQLKDLWLVSHHCSFR